MPESKSPPQPKATRPASSPSPTLEATKAKSAKEGKAMLKKLQTKITKKTSELKQLIAEQESSVKALKDQIEHERKQQDTNKAVYEQAMKDVQDIQKQIQEAEKQFGDIQQQMEKTKKDNSDSISGLQAELQALQQETADKHKIYEESIQFFFSPSKTESPR